MGNGGKCVVRGSGLSNVWPNRSNPTATTQAAIGSGAKPDADDLEIPQNLDDGSSDMTNEVLAQAKRDLHDAIEVYMRVAYENVLATTDWLLISENVMSDDDETRMLHPAISEHMSRGS